MTVRGLRNNNPGNLRANAFRGFLHIDEDGYAVFDTLDNGIRAAARQLKLYLSRGTDSVEKIIRTWAPPEENRTAKYVGYVASYIGVNSRAHLQATEVQLFMLLRAIFNEELGVKAATAISDDMILKGVRAA